MPKYIEVEELDRLVQNEIYECTTALANADEELTEQIFRTVNGANRVLTIAKNMPSIEIVRCVECKHYISGTCRRIIDGTERYCEVRKPSDYCSYGERMEETNGEDTNTI